MKIVESNYLMIVFCQGGRRRLDRLDSAILVALVV